MEYEYETFDTNPQRVKPNVQEVNDILAKHEGSNDYEIDGRNEVVKVTLFTDRNLTEIVSELTELEYSFTLDNGFEVPIVIKVDSRINPEL
jgi:hypothetical protein